MKHIGGATALGLALVAIGIVALGAPESGWITSSQRTATTAAAKSAATNVETVTLEVGNMTCASCSYIVRRALQSTPGVTDAEVSIRERLAVVTFDPAKTTVADLIEATSAMGYPSRRLIN